MKSEDVSLFFCGRDYESGGNPDLSVCLFLVWHCRGQHKSGWMAGSFGSVCWNLSLVGRAYCCGCPGQKEETGGQLPEDEPDFRSSIELVWNPCFYKGNPNMKLCKKVEKGAGKR